MNLLKISFFAKQSDCHNFEALLQKQKVNNGCCAMPVHPQQAFKR